MSESVAGRYNMEVQKSKLETKKTKVEGDIGKLQKGERNMSTILKKQSDATQMQNRAERTGGEIDDIDVLLKLITIHLGETVIP